MPLVIPPFAQFQGTTFPLRGLWNHKPPEGDKFVNLELDWGTFGGVNAVQFALSGNSPVALSQIVALFVDNSRCASDVQFVFPDSGFTLTVPAYIELLSPVLTNALQFYAVAPTAALGDVTVAQVLNSVPPPIPIVRSEAQNHGSVGGISLAVNATTQVVPAGVSGTLNAFSITLGSNTSGTAGSAVVTLQDGQGTALWQSYIDDASNQAISGTVTLSSLAIRFFNGVQFVVALTSLAAGSTAVVNLYYGVP